jgi:hypothetical protein
VGHIWHLSMVYRTKRTRDFQSSPLPLILSVFSVVHA